jgi:alkylhydroperoxidase/carboxymuconolactone decarboxylase family protein YurZ
MPDHFLVQRTSTDTDGEVKRILGKLEESGRDLRIVRLVANWAPGFRPFVLSSDALLFRGHLDPVIRELVVLYLAARQRNEYEWDEHIPIAARVGVSDEQRAALEAFRSGADALDLTTMPAEARAAVALARSVLEDDTVDPSLWDGACVALGGGAALEVVFAVAWWGGYVPLLTKSLLQLEGPASEHSPTERLR